MEEQFSRLVNLLWGECIQNLSSVLEESEQNRFTNNDYYYLYVIEALGEPNFSTIADALNVTRPGVTAIVRKLCNMGLVMKCQSEKDKRVYYVSLTQKGKDILNGDREVYKRVTEAIARFCKTKEEQQFMENVIEMLVQKLEKKEE